jgi:multicomponent Na+:H+ antiporter subunit G
VTALELLSAVLLLIGVAFFAAGTIGLLRFPDVATRLHAVAKADNLGLGFLVSGLVLLADDGWSVLRLVLTWLVALASSSIAAQLVLRHADSRDAMKLPGQDS